MRYFFEISYHGGCYHGWQRQKNAMSVQQVVEEALTLLFKTPLVIVGSGRTDTGVHCASQYFHVDIEKPFSLSEMLRRINAFLPCQIAIRAIRPVKPRAHARYDARMRAYRYQIAAVKMPLLIGLACHYFKPVNVEAMQAAANFLLGEKDFSSFSKTHTDAKHFLCRVHQAAWRRDGDLLFFHIQANRFLRGMVRCIVGTLLDVGTGKISPADFDAILRQRNRKHAGMNAPSEGLCLMGVTYPEDIFL